MDDSARGVPARPFAKSSSSAAIVVVIAALAAAAVALLRVKLHRQPLFVDFLVMWTGGRVGPHGLYDFVRIDEAQAWLLGARAHDRPFPYPPSTLLVFAPLARLPFWIAAAVWSLGGIAAFGLACWRLTPGRRPLTLAAIFVLPGVVWAALSGQCAFAEGALAIAAMIALDRRPALAGVALGVALMLKPTLLIMAPVALAVNRRWRALAMTAVAGAGVVGLSLAVFGLRPWIDWLTIAPAYLAKISADPRYATAIIAPAALASRLGLTPPWAAAWRVAWLGIGAIVAASGFRAASGSPVLRLIAVVAGSLLAAPYAMNYETTLLAPAAAILMTAAPDRRSAAFALAAYGLLAVAGFPNVSVYAFMAYNFIIFAFVFRNIRTVRRLTTGGKYPIRPMHGRD